MSKRVFTEGDVYEIVGYLTGLMPEVKAGAIASKVREAMDIVKADSMPVFGLQAHDKLAYETIDYYEDQAESAGCSPSFLENLRKHKNEFGDWQIKNSEKMKRPG